MHELEVAARGVIENWDQGNLAQAVCELDRVLRSQEQGRLECADAIQRMRDQFTTDECVIDTPPLVAPGDGGAFVAVWIWMPQSS